MTGRRFERALAAIVAAHALLALAAIGRGSLWNIDEGRVAEVSREMAASGDWLVPRIGGAAFASYPPLGYWLMAASGSLLGFHEFSMRLPSALAGIGLVALIGLIGRRLAGPAAGLGAALVLATLGGFYRQEILCRADVLTAFFGVWAFYHFLGAAEGRSLELAGFYAACALGTLAKGPVALVVAGSGVLAWLAVHRRWVPLRPGWGVPAYLALVVPWYVAVYRSEGPDFLRVNLMLENANAFVSGYQQRRPFWFYLYQLPLTSFPWILALPATAWVRRGRGAAVALLWLAGVFLFFTASSAKRPSYLAYLYPALALTIGVTLADALRRRPRAVRIVLRGAAGAIALGALLVLPIPRSAWTSKAEEILDFRFVALPALAVVAIGVGFAARRPRQGLLATALVLAFALGVYGVAVVPATDVVGREGVAFCRRAAAFGEPPSVVGPEETEGFFHFYMRAALPKRSGETAGLYLLTEDQRGRLEKDGRSIDVLDQTRDERGRAKLLARVGRSP